MFYSLERLIISGFMTFFLLVTGWWHPKEWVGLISSENKELNLNYVKLTSLWFIAFADHEAANKIYEGSTIN